MFKLKKIKYLIVGVIIGSLTSVSFVAATPTVKLIVNGEDITYKSDVPPQIINGRTLVPARALAESLGASVEWDGGSNSVVVSSVINQSQNNLDKEEDKTTTPPEQNNNLKPHIDNGVDCIVFNNAKYVSVKSIYDLSHNKGYSFAYDSNTNTSTFLYNSHPARSLNQDEVLVSDIKTEAIEGRSYILYDFYINNILPLIT